MTMQLQSRLTEAEIEALPKIELHSHLDTSVRINTVADLGKKQGVVLPADLYSALVVPMDNTSLVEYLKRIDWQILVLQTEEAIYRATYELLEDYANENTVYVEIRFAPQLFTRKGLTDYQVIAASSRAVRDAERDFKIKSNLIMCCLRHEDEETSLNVVKNALKARDNGFPVVALDIAADESLPGHPHVKAFELAQKENLHRTCHAGEAEGADSIRYALEVFGAERIGHGVRLREDRNLLDYVRRHKIALEMCPTSNIQTKATPNLADHPANDYLDTGIPVTINTDGRTTTHTSLTKEYASMVRQFDWGRDEIRQSLINAAHAAFLPSAGRSALVAQVSQI
jgi:adenosine deaminase